MFESESECKLYPDLTNFIDGLDTLNPKML